MSKAATYWVENELIMDKRLSPTEFRILLFLAMKARDDYHNCWWSERRIAENLGCSKGTVSKAVRKFSQMNLMNIKKGAVANTKHKKHNIYYLHVPYEYRRRGHKAVNGESIAEDFDLDGEFDHDSYEERLSWDYEEHDNQYQKMMKQEGVVKN